MASSLLAHAWKRSFGSMLPAGFIARASIPERWLRIHSLSGSKRYATSPTERLELLTRHNSVASYVLGEASACILFITRFGEVAEWQEGESHALSPLQPAYAMTALSEDEPLHFFGALITWNYGTFDQIILASAAEETGPIMFVNTSRRTAYAPYDGGADLFFSSAEEVNIAKDKFRQWLSVRPDGL